MIHHQISSTVPETIKATNHKFQNFEKSSHAVFSTVCECSEQTHIWPGGDNTQERSTVEGDCIYILDPQKREHEDSRREKGRGKELCLSAANVQALSQSKPLLCLLNRRALPAFPIVNKVVTAQKKKKTTKVTTPQIWNSLWIKGDAIFYIKNKSISVDFLLFCNNFFPSALYT